jgi:hypothetical protein
VGISRIFTQEFIFRKVAYTEYDAPWLREIIIISIIIIIIIMAL